jgi:hypothetical protein
MLGGLWVIRHSLGRLLLLLLLRQVWWPWAHDWDAMTHVHSPLIQ